MVTVVQQSSDRLQSGKLRLAIISTLLVILFPFWVSQISGARIDGDPTAYVQMAVNLNRHGVISLDEQPPLQPSMFREPLPVLTTALSMLIIDRLYGPTEVSEYLEGKRARYLKMHNIAWILLLCCGTGWAVYLLTGSFGIALATALLAHLPFYGHWVGGTIDSLATEQATAATLMLASAALVAAATRRQKLAYSILTGVAFGLLALIKAAFLYVFIGLMVVLFVAVLFPRLQQQIGFTLGRVGLIGLCFAVTLSPWLYRNWQQFGVIQISTRGGEVLAIRATKNYMTPVEYRGAFYVWAPKPMRPLVGDMLGFGPQDLMRGGRLQRLNRHHNSDFYAGDVAAQRNGRPEEVISFYLKPSAEKNRLKRQFEAAGHPHPGDAADDALLHQALHRIRSDPGRHLAATLPFLWRGAFLPFPLLFFAVVYGLWRRRYDLLLFVLPACGAVVLYALLTHFILRYGLPIWPVAFASAAVLAHSGLSALRTHSSIHRANPKLPRPATT